MRGLCRVPKTVVCGSLRLRTKRNGSRGFTLLEIVLVISIIAIVSAFSIGRFESMTGWKQEGELRKFLNTWQFLFTQAATRRLAYRLYLDLDRNSYFVRREVPLTPGESVDVDLLANLRTRGEQERRIQEEEERSLDEEYKEEAERQALLSLEQRYLWAMFGGGNRSVKLGRPLEFPSLADRTELAIDVEINEVKTPRGKVNDGTAYIRFSPRGASEFALVYLKINEEDFTAYMNPMSGEVRLEQGILSFDDVEEENEEAF